MSLQNSTTQKFYLSAASVSAFWPDMTGTAVQYTASSAQAFTSALLISDAQIQLQAHVINGWSYSSPKNDKKKQPMVPFDSHSMENTMEVNGYRQLFYIFFFTLFFKISFMISRRKKLAQV